MTNVVGTQTLLDVAREVGVGRFVHVSTDEVYGSIPEGSWTEDEPLLPNSPYSASKAGSDLMARAYHRTHGVPVMITRCSNNYGPYQFPEKVIPLFVTNLIDGGTVPLYGEGTNVRDWLHVDDHCRGIHLVLTGGRPGETYNIGGGTELTNKELTGLLLEATGTGWDRVETVPDRLGHDLRYSVDISKIERELGYRPLVPFEQGLGGDGAVVRRQPRLVGAAQGAGSAHRLSPNVHACASSQVASRPDPSSSASRGAASSFSESRSSRGEPSCSCGHSTPTLSSSGCRPCSRAGAYGAEQR